MLLVVPLQSEHQIQGGTWYTYDYAKRKENKDRVKIVVFYPNGEIEYDD